MILDDERDGPDASDSSAGKGCLNGLGCTFLFVVVVMVLLWLIVLALQLYHRTAPPIA